MNELISAAFAISVSALVIGCSSPSENNPGNGSSSPGTTTPDPTSTGSTSTGGTSATRKTTKTNGGSAAKTDESPSSGGSDANTSNAPSGGTSSVSKSGSSGGKSGSIPKSSGGAKNSSGTQSMGGASAQSSQPSGGAANGGTSSGGAASGGTTQSTTVGTGGSTQTCALPSTFKWTSGGPIASPKSGWVSIKDFTHVPYEGKHLIYMTTHDSGTKWGAAMMVFDDWSDAATATQQTVSFGVAPTLFYFTPKKLWINTYQWGTHKFDYRTSSDPTNPSGWSAEQSLYNTALPPDGTGPIDQTIICNTTKCYLYYAGDNGHIYKSSMDIGKFPSEFPAAVDSGIQGTSQNLFEAVQVYTVQGSNKYLMIVEAQSNNGRYFRAWTATDLEGPWTLLTDNFAIKSNVTFSENWTNDISHGDLVRSSADETFPIDPCNLQLVFQGRDPSKNPEYGLLPYKMGLLTLAK